MPTDICFLARRNLEHKDADNQAETRKHYGKFDQRGQRYSSYWREKKLIM